MIEATGGARQAGEATQTMENHTVEVLQIEDSIIVISRSAIKNERLRSVSVVAAHQRDPGSPWHGKATVRWVRQTQRVYAGYLTSV